MKQTTSPAGVTRIRGFEDCRLTAYLDAAKPPVWTVGVGHTGASVTQGLVITQERADQLLASDLVVFESVVSSAVCVPLSQNQADALISFTFNVGCHALLESTLLKKLNRGDYLGCADEFLKWTRAGSVVLPGLVARRKAERALFLLEIA